MKSLFSLISVNYFSSKNAWMTRKLFVSWFKEHFVPKVREFSHQRGIPPKAVLLVDNCSAHISPELISDDGLIKVMFLPPNVTALGQPMDQGVIHSVKSKYRNHLHKYLLFDCEPSMALNDRLKTVNILQCVRWISNSWEAVS